MKSIPLTSLKPDKFYIIYRSVNSFKELIICKVNRPASVLGDLESSINIRVLYNPVVYYTFINTFKGTRFNDNTDLPFNVNYATEDRDDTCYELDKDESLLTILYQL